jgi:hypothetical protein
MLSDANSAVKWEYTIVHTDRLNTPSGPQLAPIWRRKYADGSTDWDQINKLGQEGWEMVSAFPVVGGGTLLYLAFVFKRPKRAGNTPPPLEQPRMEQPSEESAGHESEPSKDSTAEIGTASP